MGELRGLAAQKSVLTWHCSKVMSRHLAQTGEDSSGLHILGSSQGPQDWVKFRYNPRRQFSLKKGPPCTVSLSDLLTPASDGRIVPVHPVVEQHLWQAGKFTTLQHPTKEIGIFADREGRVVAAC